MANDRFNPTPQEAVIPSSDIDDGTMTRREVLAEIARVLALSAISSTILAACAPATPTDIAPARLPSSATKAALKIPEKQDYENFITHDLKDIFDRAYKTNGKKDGKDNFVWNENTASQNVHTSLNNQFDLFASLNNPITQEIDRRAKILIDPKTTKPVANLGVIGYNGRWVNYLRAIKDLFEEKGIAVVEYSILDSPPTIAVYKKEAVKTEENNTNPFGQASKHKKYIVDNQPDNVLFNSNTLLGQDYPLGLAHKQDFDEEEVFIHLKQVQEQTDDLLRVSRGESLAKPEDNPPETHKYASQLRQTAQRILADIVKHGDNIKEINLQAIKEHEDAHLQKPLQVGSSNEQRSYTAQLYSNTAEVSRLSIATYLYTITQRRYLDEISKNPSNPSYFLGIPETLADFVEGIYDSAFQRQNPEIISKLQIDKSYSGEMLKQGKVESEILHSSVYKPEYVFAVLSNLDKLTAKEINIIAQYIVTKHKREWLPIDFKIKDLSFLSPGEQANYSLIFENSRKQQAVIFDYYDEDRRRMSNPANIFRAIYQSIQTGVQEELT